MAQKASTVRPWVVAVLFLCVVYWSLRISNMGTWPIIEEGQTASSKTTSEQLRERPDMSDDIEHHVASAAAAAFSPQQTYLSRFPRIVWQTASEHGKQKYADKADTWKAVQGFQYNFLSDDEADEFVHSSFSSQPSIINFWDQLTLPVIKADFLRYLTMLAAGGVYSDIDTSCLLHPDRWIPIDLGAKTVNAIIGIEYDDVTYKMFVRPISFCQWTLMAKPGHPIFEMAVQRLMSNLDFIARHKRVTLSDLTLDKIEVLEATGPGMISDVVLQVLQNQGQNVTWETFHDQREPKLFGDVLVLPVNGFAGNQKHSHAGDPLYGEKYVQHHFGRSWYAPERAGTDAERAAVVSNSPPTPTFRSIIKADPGRA